MYLKSKRFFKSFMFTFQVGTMLGDRNFYLFEALPSLSFKRIGQNEWVATKEYILSLSWIRWYIEIGLDVK